MKIDERCVASSYPVAPQGLAETMKIDERCVASSYLLVERGAVPESVFRIELSEAAV